MHVTTALLTLATALSATCYPMRFPSRPLGAASLSRRTCSTVYPQLRVDPTLVLPYDVAINGTSGVEIGFAIPSGAVGSCNLMLSLPQGAVVSESAQVNVYALDGPAPGALVGTTNFYPGAAATINSFACRAQMCYSFRLANGQSVLHFTESDKDKAGPVGVYMTYGC